MKILLVGRDLAQRAAAVLEAAHMDAPVVRTREDAEEIATLYTYDAILLALDEANLQSSVRKVRRAGLTLPVLVLSKVSVEDVKVAVLEAGADDYIVDPFHAGELVARVHAVVRRSTGHSSSEIVVGDLSITLGQKGVIRLNNKQLKLHPQQFKMMELFMRRPGVIFSRQQILDYVWEDAHVDERTIDVHMGRLRRFLKDESGGTDYFETVRSSGYFLKI